MLFARGVLLQVLVLILTLGTFEASVADTIETQLNRKLPTLILPENSIKLLAARKQVGADVTIAKGYTGAGTSVVVMDEGTQRNHVQFDGRIIEEVCTSIQGETSPRLVCKGGRLLDVGLGAAEYTRNPDNTPYTWADHGTLVTSGVLQFAPDTKIISIKSHGNHLAALDWVINNSQKFNIAAVNMSFGGFTNEREYPDCSKDPSNKDWTERFEKLRSLGVVAVAGAGNDGNVSKSQHPACQPLVVGVGAVNSLDKVVSYSNISENIKVVAPTEYEAATVGANPNIVNGWSDIFGGTSASAPVVSALFAIGRSIAPKATPEQLIEAVLQTGKSVDDNVFKGLSRVQFDAFVEYVLKNRDEWLGKGSGSTPPGGIVDPTKITSKTWCNPTGNMRTDIAAPRFVSINVIGDNQFQRIMTDLSMSIKVSNPLDCMYIELSSPTDLQNSFVYRLELTKNSENYLVSIPKNFPRSAIFRIATIDKNGNYSQIQTYLLPSPNLPIVPDLRVQVTNLNRNELEPSKLGTLETSKLLPLEKILLPNKLSISISELEKQIEEINLLKAKIAEVERSLATAQKALDTTKALKRIVCIKKNQRLEVIGKAPLCPSGFKKS